MIGVRLTAASLKVKAINERLQTKLQYLDAGFLSDTRYHQDTVTFNHSTSIPAGFGNTLTSVALHAVSVAE